jgi:recombination protein RecT
MMKKSVVDVVAAKIGGFIANREIDLPKSYSVGNALKSAWLILQNTEDRNHAKALEVCTKDSIANALLDMIVQGLNPEKKQCYFIVYGKVLNCQRSYFGSMAVTKMVQPKVDDFAYEVVYEDDTFKYGIKLGKKIITEHEQDIKNVDKKKIIAAYCIALDKEGNPFRTDIMTMDEIKQAWKQSKMSPVDDNGNVKADSTQGKFTADMAKKTVVNRTCKAIVNASSDNALLLDRMNRAEDFADRAAVEADIEEHADKGPVLSLADATQEEAREQAETAAAPQSAFLTIKAAQEAAKTSKELAEAGRAIDGPEGVSLSLEEVNELKALGAKRLAEAKGKTRTYELDPDKKMPEKGAEAGAGEEHQEGEPRQAAGGRGPLF